MDNNGSVLVIGAGGELGYQVALKAFDMIGSDRVVCTIRNSPAPSQCTRVFKIDCSNRNQVAQLFDTMASELAAVIYCAVPTHGGAASQESAQLKAGLIDDVVFAAKTTFSLGARFVAISTDQVFNGDIIAPGKLNLYKEGDDESSKNALKPRNPYGRYKLQMETELELLAKEMHCESKLIIARTSLILTLPESKIAPAESAGKAMRFILNALSGDKKIELFTDEPRNMSFSDDLGSALVEIALREDAKGIVHLVSNEATNRFELAKLTAKWRGTDDSNAIPGESRTSGLNRPLDLSLSTDYLQSLLLKTQIRGISERLAS